MEATPLHGERERAEAAHSRPFAMATLSLRNIVKTYPGASEPTVHGFNLEIADKEFIVLASCTSATS